MPGRPASASSTPARAAASRTPTPGPYSASLGVVGAGQLARMLHEAASPLGVRLRILAEEARESAAQVAAEVSLGSPRSPTALAAFARENDVTTFDHELVDADALASLEANGHRLHPSAAVVALAQDKLAQRTALRNAGFAVPPFRPVSAPAEVAEFAEEHGWPVVAKSVRGGYDGRGVWILADPADANDFAVRHDFSTASVMIEAFVPIRRELAVLVARRPSGETAVYPVVETIQVDGICREVVAPAPVCPALAAEARRLAIGIADAVDATGILAIELFESQHGLVVNELAARPHNSGHYTIEGCVTSQFEQHLRAVLDWPLGATDMVAPAVVTVNVLGGPTGADPLTRLPLALEDGRVRVHLYGKAARPGRKLGHVTVLGNDADEALVTARRAADVLAGTDPVKGSTP